MSGPQNQAHVVRQNQSGQQPRTVFALKYPVTFQGTNYNQIACRRPKVKDTTLLIAKSDKDPVGAMQDYIGSLAEIPPGVLGELDLEDWGPIRDWATGFMKAAES
jgi:hypothetical protein